jgi:tetracycline repressor-like protein
MEQELAVTPTACPASLGGRLMGKRLERARRSPQFREDRIMNPVPTVRKTLARALELEFIGPLAKELGNGEGTKARAAAVLAVLAGFDMVRTVLGIDALGEPRGRQLLVTLLELCLEG